MPLTKLKTKLKTLKINKPDYFSYIKINAIIAGVLLLITGYSVFFALTGLNPPVKPTFGFNTASTGLSRAFVQICKGNFNQATILNKFAIPIFIFFTSSVLLRLTTIVLLFNNRFGKNLVLFTDILLTLLLFLWAFVPLIKAQLQMLL